MNINLNQASFKPMANPSQKYDMKKEFMPRIEDRLWPNKQIIQAPIWCSVDLRDGNQALKNPMTLEEKLKFWDLLTSMGFKEIEIGFPAASKVEEEFTRYLIDNKLIPDDVKIQVLSQSRAGQIEKTLETLEGAKQAVVHLYNSTSRLQREVVFKKDENEIIDIILKGVQQLKELKKGTSTNITLEYSPESFTGTEPDFALRICEEVIREWNPTIDNKIIINLPATVEMASPNIFADQVEYFSMNVRKRSDVILSVHPHNDMGMALGAAELALLAGADRVEGTLFGNGERTGNLDVLVMGLNLYSRGIDPKLNFSNVDYIRKVYEECTHMPVHPRHPYAGDVVFTAYSGSHQDAINKGFIAMEKDRTSRWNVPYLPIDPTDLGRNYEPIVINSQSGKGGAAFILRDKLGFDLPKEMHQEFSRIVQNYCDYKKESLTVEEMSDLFKNAYFDEKYIKVVDLSPEKTSNFRILGKILVNKRERIIDGEGETLLIAAQNAFNRVFKMDFEAVLLKTHEYMESGQKSYVSYVKLINNRDNKVTYGVAIHQNQDKSQVMALISALNRFYKFNDINNR